jgi:hypothetical protein
VIDDAPLGYWRLGESAGPTAADEMDTYPGTYGGACTFGGPGALAGDANPAVRFDGVDRTSCNVDLGDHFAFGGTAAFSIEAWVAYEAGGYQYQHVFTREMRNSGPVDGYAFAAYTTGGDAVYIERVVGGADNVTAMVPITTAYHHTVATYDGAMLLVYVDGQQAAGLPDATVIGNFAMSAFIGAGPDPGNLDINYFRGRIDEVAVYDHVLAPARIQVHYTIGTNGP